MASVRKNGVYGLLGFLVPTLVVLLAYPVLVRELGPQAFGVFLTASSVSGILAFLDLGFAAAIVKFLPEDIVRSDWEAAGNAIAASLFFYGGLGLLGMTGVLLLAPWLVQHFGIDAAHQSQALWVFRLAAVQFALSSLIGVFVSLFKGMQRFQLSALVMAALSVLTYGGAVLGIFVAGIGLLGVSVVSLLATFLALALALGLAWSLCARAGIRFWRIPPRAAFLRLLGFGIFMALNGMAGVLVNQVQRMVLALLLGPAAVTIFSTAQTMASKLNAALNAALEAVMPMTAALSEGMGIEGYRRLRAIYLRAIALSALFSFTGMALLYALSPWLVGIWLRSAIDGEVSALIRLLCFGLAINGLTPVVYHIINGLGRPQVNTVFFLLSPVGLYAMLYFLSFDGLELRDFAVAASASMSLNGALYLLFSEFVVWRRWIAGRVMVEGYR